MTYCAKITLICFLHSSVKLSDIQKDYSLNSALLVVQVLLHAIFLETRKQVGIFRHIWPVRLVVRTPGFRPDNRGSIPLRATLYHRFQNGMWRSLVAYSPGGRVVTGSNPVIPTLLSKHCQHHTCLRLANSHLLA